MQTKHSLVKITISVLENNRCSLACKFLDAVHDLYPRCILYDERLDFTRNVHDTIICRSKQCVKEFDK